MPSFSENLLLWYAATARTLPWRMPPLSAEKPDPYRVWLSETMLQQTTVVTVIPYFHKFLEKWPTLAALAVAPVDEVLTAWAGLGYYARARNLHKCAGQVMELYGGVFPETETELRTLAGIGPYTAAAISAIAFHRRAVVVDGNIERIISRYFALETPLPLSKPLIYAATDKVTPAVHAGDFAQALMDVGAGVCTPRSPRCEVCPLSFGCMAFKQNEQTRYPLKVPKKQRPTRYGWVFLLEKNGQFYLQQRPEKGLLGRMWEFPSTAWGQERPAPEAALFMESQSGLLPVDALGEVRFFPELTVKHTFTHFDLFLSLAHVSTDWSGTNSGQWVSPASFETYALPTLMQKVWKKWTEGEGQESFIQPDFFLP